MIKNIQGLALEEIQRLAPSGLIFEKVGSDVVKLSVNVPGFLFGSTIRHIQKPNKQRFLELIGEFKNLQHLDLRRSRLDGLSFDINPLRNLRYLDLGSCHLGEVPAWVGECYRLHYLNLAVNELRFLPENLASLAKLQFFLVHKNKISHYNPEFATLKNLRYLNLYLNKLRGIPSEVWD